MPEPILIVHGHSDDKSINKKTNSDSILDAIKIIAIQGYQALLTNMCVNDVVTLTVSRLEECKYTNATSVRGAILMDNKGKVGCVSALTTLDHPIILARRLLNENHDITIIQENIKGKRISSLKKYITINNNDIHLSDIQSWGVIARDRNEHLSGGRSSWSCKENKISLINVMMSVPGCGLLIDDKLCCSIFGDEQLIYVHAPARKIIKQLRGITSISAIRNKINCFMKQYSNALSVVVYLDENNEPLIISQSDFFPWAYCHRGTIKYGYTNIAESFSEKITLAVAFDF